MNGSPKQALDFIGEMKKLGSLNTGCDIVLFPPFTILPLMAETAPDAGIQTGGQDLFWMEHGAYTGEISPGMLYDAGATWFLAGHSERRHVIGETDEMVRLKLETGTGFGLKGILCVGELIGERESGLTEDVVRQQVVTALDGCSGLSPENLVIAYEPVWAIGTGLTATPEEAQRIHALIREWVSEIKGNDFSDNLRIQYGGSVKPSNAGAILSKPSINGALVGGASLKPGSFMEIIESVPINQR